MEFRASFATTRKRREWCVADNGVNSASPATA
jgi:hypothetical protein